MYVDNKTFTSSRIIIKKNKIKHKYDFTKKPKKLIKWKYIIFLSIFLYVFVITVVIFSLLYRKS